MVARAACNDVHAIDQIELFSCHIELVDFQMPAHQAPSERVANDTRLLVNLLKHEVGIPAFLRHIHIPRNVRRFRRNALAMAVEELNAFGREPRKLPVIQVNDIARGADDGNGIRCNVGAVC